MPILEKEKYKLVFAIENNSHYGWLLMPYAVQIMKNGMFAYNHIPVTHYTINTYTQDFSDTEAQALKALDECKNAALARTIGYGKYRTIDFAKQVLKDPSLMRRTIKHLRNKMDIAIKLLAEKEIPIYFKGDPEDIINEQPIIPLVEKLHVLFKFEITDESLIYSVKTDLNGKEFNLTNNKTIILNYDPCWLISDNKFLQVDNNVDGKKIQPFLTKNRVVVEYNQVENYLKKFVLYIISSYPFELNGIECRTFNDNPIPELSIETTLQNEVLLRLCFKYKNETFDALSDKSNKIVLKKENNNPFFEITYRNFSFEEDTIQWLIENGLMRVRGAYFLPRYLSVCNNENNIEENILNVVSFINENANLLHERGVEISNIFNKKMFIGQIAISKKCVEVNDWFDMQIIIKFNDFEVPFNLLRKNILENNRKYLLPDGSIAILPSEWFAKFRDLALIGEPNGDKILVKKNQYSLIHDLFDGESRIEQFIQKSASGNFPIEEAPSGLLKELRPYQLKGMSWFMYLQNNNFGGCLSDDMGLGKTIQVIAFILKNKQKNDQFANSVTHRDTNDNNSNISTSLIVMPLSLVHNWENEIKNTAPSLNVFVYTGIYRSFSPLQIQKFDLVLTTYGTVRNDIEKLSKFKFKYVFLDESQYIKSPSSMVFAAVSKLNAENRFVLTGTPVENSLIDLWSQLNFVNPGILGDLKYFKDRFYQPIERKGSKLSEKRFRQIINPFILRRTKAEVAKELPELTEKVHYCAMTDEQREIYETRKSEIRNYILECTMKYGAEKAYMIILSGLTRLRLLANHPVILEKDFFGESGKFIQVTEGIRKVLSGGHKVLIFSQFVKHLAIYEAWLDEQQIKYLKLTGQTPVAERQEMIKVFQKDPDYAVFLISLRAGGVGLNLTAADFVFLLDPWWNPAVEKQAINRTHRIGQSKKVISYKFITENSIEEKIMAMQDKKLDIFNSFINQNNHKINPDDLVGLLE